MYPGEARARLKRLNAAKRGESQVTDQEMEKLLATVPVSSQKFHREQLLAKGYLATPSFEDIDLSRDYDESTIAMYKERLDNLNKRIFAMLTSPEALKGYKGKKDKLKKFLKGKRDAILKEAFTRGVPREIEKEAERGKENLDKAVDKAFEVSEKDYTGMSELEGSKEEEGENNEQQKGGKKAPFSYVAEMNSYIDLLKRIFTKDDETLTQQDVTNAEIFNRDIKKMFNKELFDMFPSLGTKIPQQVADYFKDRFTAEQLKDKAGIVYGISEYNKQKTVAIKNAYAAYKEFAEALLKIAEGNEIMVVDPHARCPLYNKIYHLLKKISDFVARNKYLDRSRRDEDEETQKVLNKEEADLSRRMTAMKKLADTCVNKK
jgi:hypothetical protein